MSVDIMRIKEKVEQAKDRKLPEFLMDESSFNIQSTRRDNAINEKKFVG